MKKNILILFIVFISIGHFVFANTSDSLAYEAQRKKINEMLNQRSASFGSYQESLNSRTGIFGLKTKKDMQKSINILTEIIKTDNSILKETKVLLDYKNFEQQKVVIQSQESGEKNLAYMRTINKLQTELENNKTEIKNVNSSLKTLKVVSICFFLIIIGLVCLYLVKFTRKSD